MELVQSRIVTDDVEGLAAFYARLVGTPVALNEYYVEVPAGALSMIFRDPGGNLVSVFSRSQGVPG
jgi:hypothetical protein